MLKPKKDFLKFIISFKRAFMVSLKDINYDFNQYLITAKKIANIVAKHHESNKAKKMFLIKIFSEFDASE